MLMDECPSSGFNKPGIGDVGGGDVADVVCASL